VSSTLGIVIDLRLMRVPSLSLGQFIIPTRRRTLITITALQKAQTAIRIASGLWHLARRSSRSGAPLCRGCWIRRTNGSVRGRQRGLCKALVRRVLASSAPIDLGSGGCNGEWAPSLRYPGGIVPGPWRWVRITHDGCSRRGANLAMRDTADVPLATASADSS